MTIMSYITLGISVALMVALITVKLLFSANVILKAEAVILKADIQTRKDNIVILDDLLIEEKKSREVAQLTLKELYGKVPDVVYSKKLPPQIQNVLDNFHKRTLPKP